MKTEVFEKLLKKYDFLTVVVCKQSGVVMIKSSIRGLGIDSFFKKCISGI